MSKKTVWILVAVVGVGVVLLYVSQKSSTIGNSSVPRTNTSTLASALGLTSHVLTDVEKAFPSFFAPSDTTLSDADVTKIDSIFGPGIGEQYQ
jgi:hypothetical protein